MIKIRKDEHSPVEEMTLEEFERRVRIGDIGPHVEICFSVVTGDRFVPARQLEFFKGLYEIGPIAFKRYFNFERAPWITLSMILLLCGTYFFWQDGGPGSTEELLEQGAKSSSLMIELGQWWRLLTANLLHISGWHLAVNALFLFNLGGPAEAAFRRLDYLFLLVASALGATLMSTLVNPSVSCGASGVVFGVWGASAIFGIRYRTILPDRYRKYFIGSVIPYSVFALYFGVAMPGIDNWAHLGGLSAGVFTALFLPARLLNPKDERAPLKLAILALTFLVIAGASTLGTGPGTLRANRYFARNGLSVPIPQRWFELVAKRNPKSEEHTFHNRAGVFVALETSLETAPADLETTTTQFIEFDLASQLEYNEATGVRIQDPEAITVDGYPARLLRTEIITPKTAQRTDYYIITRGYYRYILSLSAPLWLADTYQPILNAIISQTTMTEPDLLQAARKNVEDSDNPATRAHLARALLLVGNLKGWNILTEAMDKWPTAGEPTAVAAQLYYEQTMDPAQGCRFVAHALQHREWTPELFILAYKLHERCTQAKTAKHILQTGLKRFPKNKTLKRLSQNKR